MQQFSIKYIKNKDFLITTLNDFERVLKKLKFELSKWKLNLYI